MMQTSCPSADPCTSYKRLILVEAPFSSAYLMLWACKDRDLQHGQVLHTLSSRRRHYIFHGSRTAQDRIAIILILLVNTSVGLP